MLGERRLSEWTSRSPKSIFMHSRLLGTTYAEIAAAHGISASLIEKEMPAKLSGLLPSVGARRGVAATASAAAQSRASACYSSRHRHPTHF